MDDLQVDHDLSVDDLDHDLSAANGGGARNVSLERNITASQLRHSMLSPLGSVGPWLRVQLHQRWESAEHI